MGSIPHAAVLRSLDLFAREVAPHLPAAAPAPSATPMPGDSTAEPAPYPAAAAEHHGAASIARPAGARPAGAPADTGPAELETTAMAQTDAAPAVSGILPLVLTHGTLEIRDVQKSMRFYRDFLGMNTVQHVPRGCRIALGGDLYIICLEGSSGYEMPRLYHWGLDAPSREDVDRWHQRALAEQAEFELSEIGQPKSLHGAYGFYFRDRDTNWWEIQYYEGDAEDTHLAWGRAWLERAARVRAERAARQAASGSPPSTAPTQ
jgi:catechol 2,3-dioxygenase-like lactoylglutathione lyase family enzyme